METFSPKAEVVLVSMPWAPPHEPSLGLAILKSCLMRAGYPTHVLHVAPELLRWLTPETYQFLADSWGVNEFLFSGELDHTFDEAQNQALGERLQLHAASRRHERYTETNKLSGLVRHLRDDVVPRLLTEVTERILSYAPKVVGFTCLFDQTIASVALAKRLKDAQPDLPIIFGGYALHGPPGETTNEAFPYFDVMVSGDGEAAIVDIVRDVMAGKFVTRGTGAKAKVIAAGPVDLETSPSPNYDDWFQMTQSLEREHHISLRTRVLPVEASRGCWWGQNSHCVFCGIDDETMKYRFKKPSTALEMLDGLRTRYGNYVFRFSDYIMPKAYYRDLLPELARQPTKFRLHSEIKANHPPERVKLLKEAGFNELQPGIESFSTPVLKAMKKGVRAIDNVNLLKAAYINGIVLDYNILYGLPSDQAEDYIDMLHSIPKLYHLTPPVSRNETVVTRFAPLHNAPERFGMRGPPKHHRCYDVLFSSKFLSEVPFSLDEYAYYFERPFAYGTDLKIVYSHLSFQIDHWKEQHRTRFVELSYVRQDDVLKFSDSRYSESDTYALSPLASEIYDACDAKPANLDEVRTELERQGRLNNQECFDDALCELNDRRVVWTEGVLCLGIGLGQEVVANYKTNGWKEAWTCLAA